MIPRTLRACNELGCREFGRSWEPCTRVPLMQLNLCWSISGVLNIASRPRAARGVHTDSRARSSVAKSSLLAPVMVYATLPKVVSCSSGS